MDCEILLALTMNLRILPYLSTLFSASAFTTTMKRAASSPIRSPMSIRSTVSAASAASLTDGVTLSASGNVMPWVGYGTYRLGKASYEPTLEAIRAGYRCIDTAFIYSNESTEAQVGKAIQKALDENSLRSREDIFVITKHWRSYHGYEETTKCLKKSLERLNLDYVDLYLMHWPGPAYRTSIINRQEMLKEHGPWGITGGIQPSDMAAIRAETWRAMEDAQKRGKVKSIGVSNFTVQHLETLKKTATIWPPAVNQVECHPLYPQRELRAYCQKEGIVLQAYAALGGQDGTKKKWQELLGGKKLLECAVVKEICTELQVTPAQVLLRYALQRNCAVSPKTTSPARMKENAKVFHFELGDCHTSKLDALEVPGDAGRLCWRTDPLRMLDFE